MVDEMKPGLPAPRPRWPFTRRQIFAQIGVAAVILISGMGIGTGGTILALKDRIIWRRPRFDPPRPPNLVKMWQTEYALSEDQTRQVEETLSKSWATTRTIFGEFAQRQQAEQAKFVEDMKTILTPEQYEKWHRAFSEFKNRAERRWRPGGPPGGRPGGPGEHRDGRREHGPFRDGRDFRPPPDGSRGPEPAQGEKDFPPPPVPEPEPRTE